MSSNTGTTTLVCLFHQDGHARAALDDLQRAGVDPSSITTLSGKTEGNSVLSTLETMGVPQRDLKHLQDGVEGGGTLIAVSAISDHVTVVERIFGNHQATKIDEAVRDDEPEALAPAVSASEGVIPIVEEELEVGKRTVDQGGVRVYRRVVEMPVEESIRLREEHVVVDRKPVDRLATPADLEAQGTRSFELTETAEEAVVGKSSHVVEEILVGKVAGEHTEHIQDTVRRTEVEIEELEPGDSATRPNKTL